MKESQHTLQTRILIYAIFLFVCVLASGCVSSYAARLENIRRDYYEYGNLEQAKKEVERWQKNSPKKEQNVLALNEASLALCSGDLKTAKQKLIEARDSFDALEAQRLQNSAESVLTYWTDDNIKSYEGEDYEKVILRAQLAIADLLDGGNDAKSYAFQIAQKQDEIVKNGFIDNPEPNKKNKRINPKKSYPRVPLGPYLEGLIWEETYLNASDAAYCYEKVVKWLPNFKQGKQDLIRAQTSVHSQPGNGRVYVFAFVGRGPHKEQAYEQASQIALLIADQIFSATNKYSVPPTIAPVPIPILVVDEPYVSGVGVSINEEKKGTTETIADVNEMAIKQYDAVKDQILARAIVRRVVKKGTLYAAKEIGKANDWVSLAMDVGGIVWEATETADTRCWGLLPAKIQALSFEAPVGKHKISLYPCDRQGNKIGVALNATIDVPANRNVYVLVNYPNKEPIGKIVVSK